MSRTGLIERIAGFPGVPGGEAQGPLGSFERVVTGAHEGGEEVGIAGFGKSSAKERKARECKNPRTG